MGCRPGFKFHLCPVELDVVADSDGIADVLGLISQTVKLFVVKIFLMNSKVETMKSDMFY